MNSPLKRFLMPLVLVLVLMLVLVHTHRAYSAEATASEKALTFLTDVVRLDLASYNAKLLGVMENGPFGSTIVKYTLESNESKLDVLYLSTGNVYVWCKLTPLKGSPLFAQPATTTIDGAKSILERYQTYSGASYLQEMRNSLDTISVLEPKTTTMGDIRLETSILEGGKESIQWMNAVNGITNTYDIVALTLRNGTFEQFCDSWNLYKIGAANVKVGQEEAIRIAKENAYIRSGSNGDVNFTNFTIVDSSVRAELKMQPKADNMLYPNWLVLFGLDKVYFNQVTGIQVSIWGDNGEVGYVGNLGGYGAAPSDQSSVTSPSPPTEQSQPQLPSSEPSAPTENNNPPTTMYIIAATTASIAVATATTTIILKKRKK